METATKIKVVGVGGCGANTVNSMIDAGVKDVSFYVVNTDLQHLNMSKAPAEHRIQIGLELTKGQGAGAKPEIGEKAAEESRKIITDMLEGTDLLFITAGMGGGTGTGASPVIDKYAREINPEMLIIAIVTKPFRFERNKMQVAEKGITKLQEYVDSLIIIPNQKLFDNDRNAILMDAYAGADDILKNSIRSISDLINSPSIINVDFADVKTIMKGKGYSHIGMGECEGESNSDRMVKAVKMAANEDTLNTSIAGATGLIFSIQTGLDLTCKELDEADEYIASLVSKDVNYIFGHSYDQSMNRKVRVTLIATGCTADNIPRNGGNMINGGLRPNFSGMRGAPNGQPMGYDTNQRPQVPSRPQPQPMPRQQQPQTQQPTRIDSVPRQESSNKDIPPFMKRLLNRK